ncbi:RNA polymerase sigma factor [Idiomarina sp. ST20R2A10]|uniref:RNA polymerase sigma factor n=1 Tax=Idiomarina sp. ST20R2A10 TaxID=3418369 RepID=UPI003EC8F972
MMSSKRQEKLNESYQTIMDNFGGLMTYIIHNGYTKKLKMTGSKMSQEDFFEEVKSRIWISLLTSSINKDGSFSDERINKALISTVARNQVQKVVNERNDHREQVANGTIKRNTFSHESGLDEASKEEYLIASELFSYHDNEELLDDLISLAGLEHDEGVALRMKFRAFPIKEIAEQMQVSNSTVTRRLRMGREKLENYIDASS